jgi:hypothetical protein
MSHPYDVLQKASRSEIRFDPFPHLVVHDALPEDRFQELARTYPSLGEVAGPGNLKNNALYKKAAEAVIADRETSEEWREFFSYHCSSDFFDSVLDLWEDTIRATYPESDAYFGKPLRELTTGVRRAGRETDPRNAEEDLLLDCQFAINSPVSSASSVRGPHIDRRYKLFAALLYFRLPEDDVPGGDLTFFRYADPRFHYHRGITVPYDFVDRAPSRNLAKIRAREVEEVTTVPYASNTLVTWINTPYCIHGVTPRAETGLERRFVNMVGEAYAGSRDGLFRIERRSGRVGRLFSTLADLGRAAH